MNVVRWPIQLALTGWLLCFSLTATAVANERIVVLPFENTSGKQEYHWLGEGLAVGLSDWLSIQGVQVITPEDRRAIYTLLSFSETAILSRASAIRIAQEISADVLLVGTYKVTGPAGREQITLSVQSIDVSAGRLAQNPFEAGAPLAELIELQGLLAWDILVSQKVLLTVSRNQFVSRLRGIHPRTFELYTKAILTPELSTKAELLRLALKQQEQAKSDTRFFPAVYELGKVYFLQEDFAAAVPWLTQIKPGGLYYQDAQFYLGLCYSALGELDKAVSVYTELSRVMPTAGVFNNLAVSEIKRRQLAQAIDYLTIALATDDSQPDLWFNAGYAYWLNSDYEMAATKLREALNRRVKEGEAHYLLAKSYEVLGRSQSAKVALEEAKKYSPTVAQWERTGQLPMLARVVKRLDRLAWLRSPDLPTSHGSGNGPSAPSGWLNRLLVAAERLTIQKKDREALTLLEVVLRHAPDSARAHFLKARIHEEKKDYASAIAEFRAATFWDPSWVAAYVRLANVYATIGDTERAREQVRKALALEPSQEEALALQDRLRRIPNQ
jgi:tetratricopeptide (TPR) repeat protein